MRDHNVTLIALGFLAWLVMVFVTAMLISGLYFALGINGDFASGLYRGIVWVVPSAIVIAAVAHKWRS